MKYSSMALGTLLAAGVALSAIEQAEAFEVFGPSPKSPTTTQASSA